MHRRAFTLVEMLVSMALFAVLMTMSYSVILTTQRIGSRAAVMRDVQTEARNIIDLIGRDIKSDRFCGLTVSPSELKIETKSGTGGCSLTDVKDTKQYTYNSINQNIELNYQIKLDNITGAIQVNSSFVKITSLTFSGKNDNHVSISATFTSVHTKYPYSFDIQTTISPEINY